MAGELISVWKVVQLPGLTTNLFTDKVRCGGMVALCSVCPVPVSRAQAGPNDSRGPISSGWHMHCRHANWRCHA